jgi:hypothetical protein
MWVLAFLLAFSAWNQLGYLAETWHPPTPTSGALAFPGWLAYVVRALVVPAAFMAAAFLAPLAEPITAQIENAARATLADEFKIARKRRRRMLKEAERSGRDMTGALVDLVSDPETRRIISHAYGAIGAPVQTVSIVPPPGDSTSRIGASASERRDTRPPTAPVPPFCCFEARAPTQPRLSASHGPCTSGAPECYPCRALASRRRFCALFAK